VSPGGMLLGAKLGPSLLVPTKGTGDDPELFADYGVQAGYEGAAIRSAQAWADMARKMDAFTSQVLLSLLETYQALEKMEKK